MFEKLVGKERAWSFVEFHYCGTMRKAFLFVHFQIFDSISNKIFVNINYIYFDGKKTGKFFIQEEWSADLAGGR